MIHILPVNDLEEHIEETHCNCNPKIIINEVELIVVHNSYDGREFEEQIKDILNCYMGTKNDLEST